MSEHALTIHSTNAGSLVPVCACGWVGTVQPVPAETVKSRKKRHPGLAARRAELEHGRHRDEADPDARPVREFACGACRGRFVLEVGSTTCPNCAGMLDHAANH